MTISRDVLDTLETALWCAGILVGVAAFLWVLGTLLTVSGVLTAGAILSGLSILFFMLAFSMFLYVMAKVAISSAEVSTETLARTDLNLAIGSEVMINLPGNEWHGRKGTIRSFNGLMVTVQFGNEVKEVYPRHLVLVQGGDMRREHG